MTIDEAIETLSQRFHDPALKFDDDYYDALKLGIEALKLLQNPTDPRLIYARRLLIGETEE